MVRIPPSSLPGCVVALLLVFAPVAAGAAATIEISRKDCHRLTEHRARGDVAFQPGVGRDGRAVVPADLDGGSRVVLPERHVFVLEFTPFPDDPELEQSTIPLGVVTLDGDGRAYFDGMPLESEAQFELARRCRKLLQGES